MPGIGDHLRALGEFFFADEQTAKNEIGSFALQKRVKQNGLRKRDVFFAREVDRFFHRARRVKVKIFGEINILP